MREILFRGKIIEPCEYQGQWLEGFYAVENGKPFIAIPKENGLNGFYCDPETVGQYTGLKDKNGKKIFEGDICWFYGGDYYSGLWEQNAIVAITNMTDDEQTHYLNNAEYCEIIGNIFDNPELLEGDKT